jgi:hypothetical protein
MEKALAWPTPVTTDAKGARRNTAATSEWKSNPGDTLLDAVRIEALARPTPLARDMKGPFRKSTKAGTNLPHMVELEALEASARPTPTANRYGSTNNGDPGDGREQYATAGTPSLDTIATQEGGKLNPEWVETLMGAPVGWTGGPPAEVWRNTIGSRRAASRVKTSRGDRG